MKMGIAPGPVDKATCIAELYNPTRRPILQFWANTVKLVTFICSHGHAHSRSAWVETLQTWLPYMGKLQSARTLILRCESKIWSYILKFTLHSACPFHSLNPFLIPDHYFWKLLFLFYLVCNYNNLCDHVIHKGCKNSLWLTSLYPRFKSGSSSGSNGCPDRSVVRCHFYTRFTTTNGVLYISTRWDVQGAVRACVRISFRATRW